MHFIQTEIPQEEGKDCIILKIRGKLVDILVQIDPATYEPFVTYERGEKILYCNVMRAIYGMLTSALLFYKKWCNCKRLDNKSIHMILCSQQVHQWKRAYCDVACR